MNPYREKADMPEYIERTPFPWRRTFAYVGLVLACEVFGSVLVCPAMIESGPKAFAIAIGGLNIVALAILTTVWAIGVITEKKT